MSSWIAYEKEIAIATIFKSSWDIPCRIGRCCKCALWDDTGLLMRLRYNRWLLLKMRLRLLLWVNVALRSREVRLVLLLAFRQCRRRRRYKGVVSFILRIRPKMTFGVEILSLVAKFATRSVTRSESLDIIAQYLPLLRDN